FRQLIFLIMGLTLSIFILIFPTKNYKNISSFILFAIILSLVGLIFYGYSSNEAVSWYKIVPMTIQPSEFAKIAIILYIATYYEKNSDNLNNQWSIIKPILFSIIIFVLVAIQPDMGTAFIIILITMMLFY